MKKGELSMTMIITAVIVIIILVIVIFLLLDASGNTRKATKCPGKGGVCVDSLKCQSGGYVTDNDGYIPCSDAGQVCCNPGSVI
jgi:hypothetical protein